MFRKMLYIDSLNGSKRHKKKKNSIPSDGYVEKYDFRGQPTVVIKDFEPEVFKLLIDYTHTGSVVLQSRTLLGLMNAADYFCLEELKQACISSIERCITIDSVCVLLRTSEKYIQFKSTKTLIQKILEFVDVNADAVLQLKEFVKLPQHIVRIVLGREELGASELDKFEAAYRWSLQHCQSHPSSDIKVVFEPFMDVINYNDIPALQLMQRVKRAGVVDNTRLLNALAFQADPTSVLPVPPRPLSAISMVKHTSSSVSSTQIRKSSIPPPINALRGTHSNQFRRVQSSGTHIDFAVNRHIGLSHLVDSRDARAGSAPLKMSDGILRSPRRRRRVEEVFVKGVEVHPLHTQKIRDSVTSSNSSHVSERTTPPPSPTLSFSGVSNPGSMLSVSSGGSGGSPSSPVTVPGRGVVVSTSGSVNGGRTPKLMNYNPQALDAVVNCGPNSAVEV